MSDRAKRITKETSQMEDFKLYKSDGQQVTRQNTPLKEILRRIDDSAKRPAEYLGEIHRLARALASNLELTTQAWGDLPNAEDLGTIEDLAPMIGDDIVEIRYCWKRMSEVLTRAAGEIKELWAAPLTDEQPSQADQKVANTLQRLEQLRTKWDRWPLVDTKEDAEKAILKDRAALGDL